MTTPAVRLTQLEAAVDRLVASRGPRVSDLLKQGRVRLQQGEVAPALYDIAVLEQDAKLPGLRGAMARARLRMLRGFDREALQTGTVERKDVDLGGVGCSSAPDEPRRSTAPIPPATATSETVRRIDQLLAAASARA
jgi:hypothetical protein